ncbi:hypothetical protein [Polaribacter ponticola]|uniref:DUF4292 domain-containing protein n=1 Tax=Polaribacter ponticola TaxID=2978475 RepID=A0ABT5SB09_9FLAO|nr:hypothetical protein [Polaribacter sp. MSW5]MDD7915299.1 hypothetical protein [Polaribacter sp. MSW5]
MKFRLLLLFATCFAFYNCSNKKQEIQNTNKTNSINYILDSVTDTYTIKIKEDKKTNFRSFKNAMSIAPTLNINAEFISLKQLISVTKNIDTNAIILNKDLKNSYYKVYLKQKNLDFPQDSLVRNIIIASLGIKIDKKNIGIDTIMVSVKNSKKYRTAINKKNKREPITSKYINSNNIKSFENYQIKDILAVLGKEFNKNLVFTTNAQKRVNISFKEKNWESIKTRLELDLGLFFDTKTYPKVKYIITEK